MPGGEIQPREPAPGWTVGAERSYGRRSTAIIETPPCVTWSEITSADIPFFFFFFQPHVVLWSLFFVSRGLDQWLLLSRGGGVIKTFRSLYCFLSECNTNSNSSLDCHRVRYQWLLNGCEDTFSHCYGSVPQLKMLRKWKEFCDCSLKAKISNLVVYQRAREWDKGIKLACGIEATSRNSYHLQAIWNSCSFYLCIGLESVPCVGVILPQVYRVVGALASCHYLTFPR